jgi:hypothetical protein
LAQPAQFDALLSAAVQTEWVAQVKRSFGGAEIVLKYLARYTHKAAISNHRLVDLVDGQVTFLWKDYAHGGRPSTMTLDAVEFVRRFLMHVLPAGFVRFRSYGLLANCHRQEKLARCRELLGTAAPQADTSPPDAVAPPAWEATVTATRVCPRCGADRMIVIAEPPRISLGQEIVPGPATYATLDSS